MNVKKLASLLEAIREGETNAALAKSIGIPPATLGTYLRGQVKTPSTEVLTAIAAYMKISIDDLIEQISDEPKTKSLKEKGVKYCIATFEELAPAIDNLSQFDLKRIISYAANRIAV